jgi:hypothetical protein
MRSRTFRLARRVAVGLLLGMVVSGSPVWAQQSSKQDTCRQWFVNRSGTDEAPITVSTSAITVVAANQKLCAAIILNFSEADTILCRAVSDGAPTDTVGFPVTPGGVLGLEFEASRGVQCVRANGSSNDVPVYTIELEP